MLKKHMTNVTNQVILIAQVPWKSEHTIIITIKRFYIDENPQIVQNKLKLLATSCKIYKIKRHLIIQGKNSKKMKNNKRNRENMLHYYQEGRNQCEHNKFSIHERHHDKRAFTTTRKKTKLKKGTCAFTEHQSLDI